MSKDLDLNEIKEKVLKTQVRVKTAKAGGSGTIIYSAKNKKGKYSTYCLTCSHVIDSAIDVRKEWDPKIGRHIKKEYRQTVTVEFFDWENVPHGHRPVNSSVDAEILAYDKDHDMAILKLRTIKPAANIAELCNEEDIEKIGIGERIWACGCAMLHDPILTNGRITHMGDEIDYKDYWMGNAQIIFGNSGGAVFLEDGCLFIGIPSRIDVHGWGTPITHLGYFSPIHRIYQFLKDQTFNFIFDSSRTEEEDEKERLRIKKREEERKQSLLPDETADTEDDAQPANMYFDWDSNNYHYSA